MSTSKKLMFADAVCVDKDSLVFANWEYNGIYCFNINKNETNAVIQLPEVDGIEYNQYHIKNIVKKDNSLFLFMFFGICVFEYNMDTGKSEVFIGGTQEERYSTISQALCDHDVVWQIPETAKRNLYSFDLKEKKIKRHENWKKQIKKYMSGEMDVLSPAPFIKDGEIWTCILGTSKVLRYNLENEEMSMFEIAGTRITNICPNGDGDDLWIVQDNQIGLLRYSLKTGKFENYIYENIEQNERPFSRIVTYDKYIIVLPRFYNKVLFFHKDSKEFFCVDEDNNNCQPQLSARFGLQFINNKMYLFPWGIGNLTVIDMNTLKVETVIKMEIPKEYFERLVAWRNKKKDIMEEKEISLSEFIKGVTCWQDKEVIINEDVGSKIFKEIKRTICV